VPISVSRPFSAFHLAEDWSPETAFYRAYITAFEIVQQLALQGHPVPLNLLLLHKAFLTLDGITRQLDPDFNAWLETLAYSSGVFASEAVRANLEHSVPVTRPARFLSFRAAHANARGSFRGHDPKKVCANAKHLLARFGNPCDLLFRSSRNHPEPSQRKEARKKHEC
jgi:hypothetical protein